MKKSTFLCVLALGLTTLVRAADVVLPQGMEILTPAGVTVTVEDSRSLDKAKNIPNRSKSTKEVGFSCMRKPEKRVLEGPILKKIDGKSLHEKHYM